MAKTKRETVGDVLHWSYANLAMAHSALSNKQENYIITHYKIRAKLFKGLSTGTMTIASIFDDEKIKLQTGQVCNYCGSVESLSLDHIFPKGLGGEDDAENSIFACKSCNSSKGKKDLMEWMVNRKQFLPIMIIRRYLKLTYYYCATNNLLDKKIMEVQGMNLPFKIELIPGSYPKPSDLILSIGC